MKTIFISLALALCCIVACSKSEEKVNVPEVVKAKFTSMYPNTSAKWEMEDGKYEATFKQEKMEASVTMSPDGNIVETEIEIDPSLLPQPAKDYVANQLSGKKISSAEKITDANGLISYEAEVDHADYLFDTIGQFTGKEEEEKGEDKDKDKD